MKATRRFGHLLRHNQIGTAAVEFALITPVLLIIIMGVIDVGMAMFQKMELNGAVRSGAQLALIDSSDTSAIVNAVVDASGNTITSSDVSTSSFCECADGTTIVYGATCGDGSSNRTYMTISATTTFNGIFLNSSALNVSGSITVRTE